MQEIVDRYINLWNDPDPACRRQTIATLWRPDGAATHRQLEARGYAALEERVRTAQEKWVRDSGYVFRARDDALAHHDAIHFSWEMLPAAGGAVVSVGLEFILLDADGRIREVYQFIDPPAVAPPDAVTDLAQRFIAVWNEPDAGRRHRQVAELWAPDGAHINPQAERRGQAALAAEVDQVHAAYVAKGCSFHIVGPVDGHHGTVRLAWEMRHAGTRAGHGASLLLHDAAGRIRADYQFDGAGTA